MCDKKLAPNTTSTLHNNRDILMAVVKRCSGVKVEMFLRRIEYHFDGTSLKIHVTSY